MLFPTLPSVERKSKSWTFRIKFLKGFPEPEDRFSSFPVCSYKVGVLQELRYIFADPLTLSSGAHLRGDMLLTTERLNWTELNWCCSHIPARNFFSGARCPAYFSSLLLLVFCPKETGSSMMSCSLLLSLRVDLCTQAPEAWEEVSHSLQEFVSSMSPPKGIPELNVSKISVGVWQRNI